MPTPRRLYKRLDFALKSLETHIAQGGSYESWLRVIGQQQRLEALLKPRDKLPWWKRIFKKGQ